MIHLLFRHIRHYRLQAMVLALIMTLAAVSVWGFFMIGEAIATHALQQSLEALTSGQRTIEISGPRQAMDVALDEQVRTKLGDVIKQRLEIRRSSVSPDQPGPSIREEPGVPVAHMDIYSFDRLPAHINVIEGRLPEQVRLREAEDSWRPPPIEVTMSPEMARHFGYGVGDQLSGSDGYHRFQIVGLISPLDPEEDSWGGDLSPFYLAGGQESTDPTTLALMIHPGSMRSHYPERPIFPHQLTWRLILDYQTLRPQGAIRLRRDLVNLQTQVSTRSSLLSTELVHHLDAFIARYRLLRFLQVFLAIQLLAIVLYASYLVGTQTISTMQEEGKLLRTRGASAWQASGILAIENLLWALLALFITGPGLGVILISATSDWPGRNWGSFLSPDAWLWTALVMGLLWGLLAVVSYQSVRHSDGGQRPYLAPTAQQMLLHRYHGDIYLLVAGALLTWQLNQRDSLIVRILPGALLVDPLLLLGPSLMLLGGLLILIRLWPYFMRLSGRLSQRWGGVMMPVSLLDQACHPATAARMLLVIALVTGISLFALLFSQSVAGETDPMIRDGVSNLSLWNTVVLTIFALAAFTMTYGMNLRQRQPQLEALITLGLSRREGLVLLLMDTLPVILSGLLLGTGFGLGLIMMVRPYLSQTMAIKIDPLTLAWLRSHSPVLLQLDALFLLLYGLALMMLALGQQRKLPHPPPNLGGD